MIGNYDTTVPLPPDHEQPIFITTDEDGSPYLALCVGQAQMEHLVLNPSELGKLSKCLGAAAIRADLIVTAGGDQQMSGFNRDGQIKTFIYLPVQDPFGQASSPLLLNHRYFEELKKEEFAIDLLTKILDDPLS